MNEHIRNLVKQSGLDIYGLGLDREKWEATVGRFAELIVADLDKVLMDNFYGDPHEIPGFIDDVKKHFGVEQ